MTESHQRRRTRFDAHSATLHVELPNGRTETLPLSTLPLAAQTELMARGLLSLARSGRTPAQVFEALANGKTLALPTVRREKKLHRALREAVACALVDVAASEGRELTVEQAAHIVSGFNRDELLRYRREPHVARHVSRLRAHRSPLLDHLPA